MALDFQLASVKFNQGLDTRTEHKLVVPGKWAQLQNVTLGRDGSLRKRDGVAQLATAAVGAQNGNGLATHNKQLLAINGGAVASVATALTQALPVAGRLGWVDVAKSEVRRSTGMQDSCDVATGGGYTCYVWREKTGTSVVTGVNVTLVDEATGAVVLADTQMRTSPNTISPRVVFCQNATGTGGVFYAFYSVVGVLHCRAISTATPTTLSAESTLVAGGVGTVNFDCCSFGTGTGGHSTAMVSYVTTVAPASVVTIQVEDATTPVVLAGPTTTHTAANIAAANVTGIACIQHSSTVAATFVLGAGANPLSGTSGATIDPTWAVVTAATLINANPPAVAGQCHITAVTLGQTMRVATDDRSAWGTAANNPIDTFLVTSAMVQSGATVVVAYSADFAGAATDPAGPRGPYIAGKAFVANATVFLPVEVLENYQSLAATKASNSAQSTVFLMEIGFDTDAGPVNVVAKALYGAVGVATINNVAPTVSTPCSTPALSAGGFAYATTERTLLSFVGGFNVSPTGVVRLTWTPNATLPPSRVQLGETTYISGGVLSAFDGAAIAEHGFNLFPEGINVEVVAAGGAMTAGVHQVVAIYEWVDNAGQRHQSAPSLPVSATVALNDRLRVRVPTLHLTQKVGVTIAIYITQANGLTFNRVGTTAAGAAGTPNDVTVAYVTMPLIDAADTAYAANELLYTQPLQAGTTLPNHAPPPCTALAVHQNRLWWDVADQTGVYGFSQPYVNNKGLQCNVNLAGTVDVSAGAIVGISPLDEKLILFCSRKLVGVFGDGPNLAGGFSNFSEPQEIPSDVGCGERRSLLRMPNGIIFKSNGRGWHLLTRDLAVRYIGGGVAQYDANNVTSAVLLENRKECRFTTTTPGSSGVAPLLVYSYLFDEGQWSTSTPYSTTLVGPYNEADSLWWATSDQLVHISTNAGLNRDTPGVYSDAPGGATGRVITCTARTSHLHLAEIGGFQRVRWLYLTMTGDSAAVPTSSFAIFALFDDTTVGGVGRNYIFTEPLATALAGQPRPQDVLDLRHKLQVQKCKSVAFGFVETPAAVDAPQIVGLQALTLEVGLRKGVNRLPAAQTVG